MTSLEGYDFYGVDARLVLSGGVARGASVRRFGVPARTLQQLEQQAPATGKNVDGITPIVLDGEVDHEHAGLEALHGAGAARFAFLHVELHLLAVDEAVVGGDCDWRQRLTRCVGLTFTLSAV